VEAIMNDDKQEGVRLEPIDRAEFQRLTEGMPRTRLTPEDREAVLAARARVAAGERFLVFKRVKDPSVNG
jgi:hypothetical protein